MRTFAERGAKIVATILSFALALGTPFETTTFAENGDVATRVAEISNRTKTSIPKETESETEAEAKRKKAKKEKPKKVVLAGSSSMALWRTAGSAFAPYETVNVAVGGTTVDYWMDRYEKSIVAKKPDAVVLYVGSNDMWRDPEPRGTRNARNTQKLIKAILKRTKRTKVFYVSLLSCMARQRIWIETSISNAAMKRFCAKTNRVFYVDLEPATILKNGNPNPRLFRNDGLHPNAKGYEAWKKVVVPAVKRELRKSKKK